MGTQTTHYRVTIPIQVYCAALLALPATSAPVERVAELSCSHIGHTSCVGGMCDPIVTHGPYLSALEIRSL